jgi:hypothetical protein
MTAVLLWKEYRQQRAFWLAIALLAVLLVISLSATMGHGNGAQMVQEKDLRATLMVLVFVLAISYGVVSGALVLAGERDDGTMVFLDSLPGRRGLLWQRKCLAGLLLTLSQSLALIALSVGMGFASWTSALLLPVVALDAFTWGLLGGAQRQRVMSAVLTGIAYMSCSWLVLLIVGDYLFLFVLVKLGAAYTAGYASWRRYTAVDRLRQPDSMQPQPPLISLVPASVRVLVWLILRQGRWTLAASVGGALLLAASVNLAAYALWPVGTTLLGLACGLATFVDDQNDGVRFLGAQRFPPGRIWMTKIVFWGMALFALITVAWVLSLLALVTIHPDIILFRGRGNPHWWFEKWMHMNSRTEILDPLLFLGIWPLYGFGIGQYFAQVMPRPTLAAILALFLSPLVAIWIPSFLFGGLALWQVLVVPVLLLLLTRINQWPWLSGRLLTGRPLVVLVAGNVFVLLSLAAALSYRVFEIPDVGEPFDVPAFIASLPSREQNEAGPLIRRAGLDMHEWRAQVEKELPPPTQPLFPDQQAVQGAGGPLLPGGQGVAQKGAAGLPATVRGYDYNTFLAEIVDKGWPRQDREMVRWLDRMFADAWVQEAETAARLPLGMIQDPRHSDGAVDVGHVYRDCRALGTLFTVRALQRQAQGDARAALKDLETALALSRQVKNLAVGVFLFSGLGMERDALTGYRHWLRNVPSDKALLRDGLAVLQHHEAANPTPENAIKAQYLSMRENDPVFANHPDWVNELLTTSYQVPWEKERQRRLARALVAGLLQVNEQPQSKHPVENNNSNIYAQQALRLGLPPRDGPGSRLGAAKWGELLVQFLVAHPRAGFLTVTHTGNILTLHAAELATALALYQIDHGTPDSLDVLVPDYLAALPTDPASGAPLGYRISKGETIAQGFPPITLVPGQAVVFVERAGVYFPLPLWAK